MKYFINILKQFTQAQRLIVLILLLSFSTGGILISQYLKTDDCKPLIEENLKMQNDFARISAMLRAERLKEVQIQTDSVSIEPIGGSAKPIPDNKVFDEILKIAESNK